MKLNRISWTIFCVLSLISLGIWLKFSYPQLAFINYSIDRDHALKIAEKYLSQQGYDVTEFRKAILLGMDLQADRYLQKTVGFEKLKEFIKEHDFDMFFWLIRFFKENDKEEYRLTVSSSSGEVTSFKHTIDDSAARKTIEREEAKESVKQFLNKNFGFNPDDYSLRGDLEQGYDNRSDFVFTWQKNNVNIPWNDDEKAGSGKLLTGATISGEEILSFSKNTFDVPDQFNRYLDQQNNIGRYIATLVKILYIILFTATIFFVASRRNHLAMHTTKRFYITLMLISFVLSLFSSLNHLQDILFGYSTTWPFRSYLMIYAVDTIIDALFITVAILTPGLSGELLHFEAFPEKKSGSFLHYIHSTFFSRQTAQLIFLGYCVCFILLGMQSSLIQIGQKYLGVWVEHSWVNSLSSAYLPFLAAFTIGYKASLKEEILFRLFAISWGKKLFKNVFVAVILSSLLWGFAHSNYPVFPKWFRGVEVTCLGLFLSFIYLRFGIIPVIVGHYLFDVFWSTAGFIFGQTTPLYFYSCLCVLLLPLIFSITAFFINKTEVEKPLRWRLNKHQWYNLEILKAYLNQNKNILVNKTKDDLKEEIASHCWDTAVVDIAVEDFLKDKKE